MTFTPQFLDELRNRLPIAEVVGRKMRLLRRGREHVGLCPFHSEKSPSFTVSEEKGFFHCFGCGAHGDVVGFVMRSEGLSFPEAVEKLAEEAGLPVPSSTPEERARAHRDTTLLGVTEAAAAWYEAQLRAPAGREGLAYLLGRGLDEATISRFRLGYAPAGRGPLRAALAAAGFPQELMLEAGLIGRSENGEIYDRFRDRVMFPIADRRGRVVAFGGRTLGDGEPKYLNSPETPLFHKGRLLYGLAQALKPARDTGEIVVAEGYMDVIALSQNGFAHAVAPLGTALTEDQIGELWKLVAEPTLCFDGDAAGQRAAARAADRALPMLRPGRSLRFALLPAGEDPDSLIRTEGGAAVRAVLDRAQPLVAMLWDGATAGRRFDTPERRAGLRQHLRERVAGIADRSVQEAYRLEMDRRFDADFGYDSPGRRQRSHAASARSRPARSGQAGGQAGGQAARLGTRHLERLQQEILLAVVVNHPELLHDHSEELAGVTLKTPELDKLRRAVIDLAAGHPDLDSVALKGHLTQMGFARAIDGLLANTRETGFATAQASTAQAGEGLRHVLGLMREREARRDTEAAAKMLARDMSGEALARFEAKQRMIQDGESRRRDLDGGEAPAVRSRK